MAMESMRLVGTVRLAPDSARPGERVIAAETPVAISFLGIGYAVMMATPADLEDLGVGFALSERIVDTADQVIAISVREEGRGILLNLELRRGCEERILARVRHRVSESSCGLCGVENLDQALRPLPRVPAPGAIARTAIFEALDRLGEHQPLSRGTGAVHAAALFDPAGALLAVREDVGRHNAMDKLVGHCLRSGTFMSAGFVLLTSRCSNDLVEKAALAGIALLVTVSAPTTLAVERAQEAGLTLIALARADEMLVMSDPHELFG